MKPNIIVFMTDQQQGATLFDKSKVYTPNVDKFKKDGLMFTKAYCTAPHCCPSRASFFSGLYPSEHGVWNNVEVSNTLSRDVYDNVHMFSEDLKENGYDLYFSGKWHVSRVHGPEHYGFKMLFHDKVYKEAENLADNNEWCWYDDRKNIDTDHSQRENGRIIRPGYTKYMQYGIDETPFDDKKVVDATVSQIENMPEDKPFFLYAGTLGPHDPYFVPQEFLDMYRLEDIELPDSFTDTMEDKPSFYRRTRDRFDQLSIEEQKESIRRYYAFCSYEDYLFGRILDAVEKKGIWDNTYIFYVSDHGDYVASHGLWSKGLPCFQEAYQICAAVGGGKIVNGNRTEDAMVSITDFAPTFLELAGISVNRPMTGKSLVPYIKGEKPESWRQEHYTQSNGNEAYGIQRSVFNSKWKYVFNAFDYDELYDLENDPHQMKNLLFGIKDIDIPKSPYGAIVHDLCKKLWNFAHEHKDNCVNPYILTAFCPYGPGVIFEDETQK